MKAILIVIDGLADEKIEELNWQTTYEAAKHPYLDKLAESGITGTFDSCPEGYIPESMPCILNLLGVDPRHYPQSRASLELLANGYELESDEVVLRCNLAAVDSKGKLISFNGGDLSHVAMKRAVDQVKDVSQSIRVIHLSDYRNLLIMKRDNFKTLVCNNYPPHEYLGENIEDLLRDICSKVPILRDFVSAAFEKLKTFGSRDQQFILYPWGISEKCSLPSFQELYQIKAAAVCGTEIARGIALALGMHVPKLSGMTGDTDTDLTLKAKTTCSLLAEHDFVFAHINGSDEAAHRHDCHEKMAFIERIDQEFIRVILNELAENTRICICADHATSPVSGKHTTMEVPYILRKTVDEDTVQTNPIPALKAADCLKILLYDKFR